jgi:hypothetical protein
VNRLWTPPAPHLGKNRVFGEGAGRRRYLSLFGRLYSRIGSPVCGDEEHITYQLYKSTETSISLNPCHLTYAKIDFWQISLLDRSDTQKSLLQIDSAPLRWGIPIPNRRRT